MPLSPWNRKKPRLEEFETVTHNSVFAADRQEMPDGFHAVRHFCLVGMRAAL
jgi:hypothetical protein